MAKRLRARAIRQAGYQTSCLKEPIGANGAQAEYLRVPLADGTLVATPDIPSDNLIRSLLAASDVLGTGWFGAVAAEAGPPKTVAVVGDGAVGLLAVLAASQLGAERIIAMSRHEPRQRLAREIHDGVAQELVMVGYGIDNALAMLPACFINPGDVTLMTVPGYPVAGTWTLRVNDNSVGDTGMIDSWGITF